MRAMLQVFRAVASAMIGVGKKKNLEKDFDSTENNTFHWNYTFCSKACLILAPQ